LPTHAISSDAEREDVDATSMALPLLRRHVRVLGSALDCGALWKQLAAQLGGRGGGRAERAEGRVSTRVPDWAAAIAPLV